MQHINRPHRPDDATADFIYEAYLLLRRAPENFQPWSRKTAMEAVAACQVSWRPVGITENALRRIGATRESKGCSRGHWYDRKSRYADLFGGTPLDRDTLIAHFYDHDTTVVVTKEEQDKRRPYTEWSRIIPVPKVPDLPEGLFPIRGFKFAVRSSKGMELPWVDAQIAQLDQPT